MKTKKIIVSCALDLSYLTIVDKLEELGVNILKKVYDVEFERYDVYTEMTKEQAYAMLDFVKENTVDGFLWKGEEILA